MADDDSAARNPLGPVGQHVIANIRQLREARKLAYTELSAWLGELGRPIPTLGLSRIERGKRRVDADDLVALALALGVNPSALLLPRAVVSPDDEIELTPGARFHAEDVWSWADGHGGHVPAGPPGGVHDFLVHARPEYQVRGQLESFDKLAREALDSGIEQAVPGLADMARREREDLDKLARVAVPGLADAARATEYAAWRRRQQEEAEDQERQLTSPDEQTTGGEET